MIRVLRLESSRTFLLPVVRGLSSEGRRVMDYIDSGDYEAVALSISPEELQTLSSEPDITAPPGSVEEEVYMARLARFGDVRKPPPCFVEAVKASQARGLHLSPLDMPEEEFTELYCREVGSLDLIRRSLSIKRLRRTSFEAESPQEFVKAFDAHLLRIPAFQRVEAAREAYMASSIGRLSRTWKRFLAMVEVERFDGVVRHLLRSHRAEDEGSAPPLKGQVSGMT